LLVAPGCTAYTRTRNGTVPNGEFPKIFNICPNTITAVPTRLRKAAGETIETVMLVMLLIYELKYG
jgi:hypothetical protein